MENVIPIENSQNNENLETNDSSVESKPISENLETKDNVEKIEDAQNILNDPNASQKEKKEAKKNIKEFKLKVYGKEITEKLDLDNEEEIVKRLQKAHGFDKASQESANMRKAAEQFIELLKTNPKKVLTDPNIGVDLKKFAQDIINEQLEEEKKSPEQKEIEKLRAELEARMAKEKEDEEKRKVDEMERLQKDAEVRLETDIQTALETSGLPKTPYTVKKMAELMMLALQNEIDIPAKDVVPILRKQMQEEIREMFSASSEDVLEEILGNDNLTRLQKRRIAKSKKAVETASSVKPTGNEIEQNKPKEEKKITIKEFFGV